MIDSRVLEALRARGEPVSLRELATRIVASPSPVAPPPPAADPTPLELATFAVVDLETTGLSPTRSAILEIGAVRVRGLRAVDRFETLVDCGRPVPPEITALTGIASTMLRGAPRAPEALARLRRWLDAAPGAPLVAHNAAFDAGFVRRGFAACGLRPLDAPVLCTRALARRLVPELRRFGLAELTGAFGIRNRAPHRALGDAEATAEALVQLVARARAAAGAGSVGELVALQRRPPRPRPPAPAAAGR